MRHLGILILLLCLSACATTTTSNSAPKKTQADQDELAKIYADMGLAYLRRGELEHAQERLEKSLSIKPKDADTMHYLAEIYHRFGRDAEAAKLYRNSIKLKPDEPNLLNNYAAFLCSQAQFDEADHIFSRVINDPTYGTPFVAYENAGRCALRKGDLVKAEAYFIEALRAQPSLARSLFHMAELQFEKEKFFKARAFFERFLAVGAKTPEVLLLGYKIEKKLGDNDMAKIYSDPLIREYRDSPETQKLREMEEMASQE